MGMFAFRLHGGSKGAADESTMEVISSGVNKGKLRLKDGGITAAKIADNSITPAKFDKVTASGLTTGVVCVKTLATTQLEALLDTSENDAIAMNAGDVILAVELAVGTACGEAATADVGIDVDLDGTTKDVDALLDGVNLNAAGLYKSNDTVADATAHTYTGADLDGGPFVCDDDGYITITSSADESASAFVGTLTVYYIPA